MAEIVTQNITGFTVQQMEQDIVAIIEQTRCKVASYINQEVTLMYWHIGQYILQQINYQDKAEYGKKMDVVTHRLLCSAC